MSKPIEADKELDEMINSLRDDAPVFPLWTVGMLKAWRDKAVVAARIDELTKLTSLSAYQEKTLRKLKLIISTRLNQLGAKPRKLKDMPPVIGKDEVSKFWNGAKDE